jgi:DNA 3'-phosphatase
MSSSASPSSNKRPDPPGDSPPTKKRIKAAGSPEIRKQSSLLQFFGKPKLDPTGEKLQQYSTKKAVPRQKVLDAPSSDLQDGSKDATNREVHGINTRKPVAKIFQKPSTVGPESKLPIESHKEDEQPVITTTISTSGDEAIIPRLVPPDRLARWKVKHQCLLIRTVPKEPPRSKAAAFDLDGTLLVWRIAGWPSRYEHYELWNSSVIPKLQQLHDDGYKLVIFSNQGAIRTAVEGKKATFVKSLLEWLASQVQRPLHVVMSTNSKMGYHKPNPGMWNICEEECNQGQSLDVANSWFVGDSVKKPEDPQGGVDEQFAFNVGRERQQMLQFYEPQTYFGPSTNSVRHQIGGDIMPEHETPLACLDERAALLGGYIKGPIVLVLVGVQGSGKSTFCHKLMESEAGNGWVHVSQDTINKGRPGKREQVENATRRALMDGKSVVVDRTHLSEEQRAYFVDIAKEAKVKVHAVVLQPAKDVIARRVRDRTNHPGGVEGDKGMRLALASLDRIVVPKYQEGFDLVSSTGTESGAIRLSQLYQMVSQTTATALLPSSFTLSNRKIIPSITLGTMGLGKRKAEHVVVTASKLGWKAVDTAPTYKNESELAGGLSDDTFVLVKVPKSAISPQQVRAALTASLTNLGRKQADLFLLHWPCDVIEAGTLQTVWQEMESCLSDGLSQALGVCNFSVNALRVLIPLCKVLPSVNQIERHPLLSQMDLVQFCTNHDILVQAHTSLAQGKPDLLQHVVVAEVAKETSLSSAQVVLKWNLQHGVAVVTKCTSEDHLKEVISILGDCPLSPDQMQRIDSIKGSSRLVAPPFMYKKGAPYSWGDSIRRI